MERTMLLSILSGESQEPIQKEKFDAFMRNVTFDHENLLFYDCIVMFSTRYEEAFKALHPQKSARKRLAHLIGSLETDENGQIEDEEGEGQTTGGMVKSAAGLSIPSMKTTSKSVSGQVTTEGPVAAKNDKRIILKTGKDIPKSLEFLKKLEGKIQTIDDLNSISRVICEMIVRQFINSNSPNEINIGSDIKQEIRIKIEKENNCYPGIFKKALNLVIVMIYQNSFQRFKKENVLTNIGNGERNKRLIAGIFGLIIFVVLASLFFTIWRDSTSWYMRFVMFLPLSVFYSSILQYKMKFCMVLGASGKRNMANKLSETKNAFVETTDRCAIITARNYVILIITRTLLLSLATLAVVLAIPPYNLNQDKS